MNISVNALCKSFGDKCVLDNVSLELYQGIYLLTGASGCGKTTFLRILSGLEKADSGDIPKCKVSFMFQEARLFPWLNAIENIVRISECNEKEALELLNILKLSGNEKKYPHELSGGMQRRVALARTLARKAELYLFDEPLAGLDAVLQCEVCNVIKQVLPKSSVAIMVSHETDEPAKIADTFLRLEDGFIK